MTCRPLNVVHSLHCQKLHCRLYRAKRRMILGEKRVRRFSRSICGRCDTFLDTALDSHGLINNCNLCSHHRTESLKLLNLLATKRTAFCRLNRHMRYSTLKHKRYRRRSGTCSNRTCPAMYFPTFDYGSINFSYVMNICKTTRQPVQHGVNQPARKYSSAQNLGPPNTTCTHCGAALWLQERVKKDSTTSNPIFSLCCKKGKVQLPPYQRGPDFLLNLLSYNGGPRSRKFRKNIRFYNSMFAFTSMGGHVDNFVNQGHAPYIFRLNGQNHHRIGSLLPTNGKPRFAQLYFYDTGNEVENRMLAGGTNGNDTVDVDVVEGLVQMFNHCNVLAQVFRSARDRFHDMDYQPICLTIAEKRSTDGRQYNLPTASEVAALIDINNFDSSGTRDIIIEERSGLLKRINEKHPSFMSMQYPILFPYGEDGYRQDIPYRSTESTSTAKRLLITMREYYAYRIQQRNELGSTLILGGHLFQQFVVDAYTCIEEERLEWIKGHQGRLRCEVYSGIRDAVGAGDSSAFCVGKKIILPSSFTGGPRYMVQNYQDAMAICRWAGSPDYFITFTCNPKWQEIEMALECIPGQRTEDRPDIVSRVFHIKLMEMLIDIREKQHFGRVKSVIYTIEFQKRGLPHAHILVFVAADNRPKTVCDVDNIVSAEIPDIISDPFAYKSVCQFMIHGPCGVANPACPCMINDCCSKHYPKKYCSQTTFDRNGFPVYRRRNNGLYASSDKDFRQDNSWVIPHNIDLVVKYQAHINVEICNKARSVKYLFKYINKGHDRASVVITDNATSDGLNVRDIDEVKTYLDCRYVSASEASWRIFKFDIQFRTPAVERLMFHLPGEQTIYFDDADNLTDVQNRPNVDKSMFTEWMKTNTLSTTAQELTYVDFPTKWVWNKGNKEWKLRQKGEMIGRIYYAHPTSGERFYLRMLLNVVKGPTSYEDIRTVDGVVYDNFKNACIARGLLEDDNEWDDALVEAAVWATSSALRDMFATMLLFCDITNPEALWDKHWKSLSEDIMWRAEKNSSSAPSTGTYTYYKSISLLEIEKILNRSGRSVSDFWALNPETTFYTHTSVNELIVDEVGYDCTLLQQEVDELVPCLNTDQKSVYDVVCTAVRMSTGGFFFVYGSGGTGKTYLWKTIISSLRAEGRIVLAVASSGIASLLLPGGRTAHSKFKIPINLHDSSTCDISKQSSLAELLRKADLIIWDEAPMIHRNALEAFEKSLKDIVSSNSSNPSSEIFGGKTILLGGDFRQTLPVVPKGSRQMIVSSAINHSPLWNQCRVFNLTVNMRLEAGNLNGSANENLKNFSKWILDVGDGKIPSFSLEEGEDPTWISIPSNLLLKSTGDPVNDIVDNTYPRLTENLNDVKYLRDRSILAPTNEYVEQINNHVLTKCGGNLITYLSADTISPISDSNEDVHNLYPTEFLNTLKISGLPNHQICLKTGVPIILLRNLNHNLGLCNGTRLIVTQLSRRVIEAEVVTGTNIGNKVLIPRIVITSSDTKWPFILRRRQFPVKVCFAMTINKSQGQTLRNVGLYLPRPVFTHGQLYVAVSRTSSEEGLKIIVTDQSDSTTSWTQNIVYKEVFDNLIVTPGSGQSSV